MTTPQPLTRAKALANEAFLCALRRSGNVKLAVRETGVDRSVLYRRRAQHPGFAQQWDAALVIAQARLHTERQRGGGAATGGAVKDGSEPLRTAGGEPVIVRLPGGRLQLRRSHPGKLTRACEQTFLLALSATANIELSAAAAGASANAFRARRRHNRAFAREMRHALAQGYDRVEEALLESWSPASQTDDAWRHNDPPPVPRMSAGEAMQLLYLHQKEARFWGERPDMKRRRLEPSDAHAARLGAKYVARLAREAEDGLLATVLSNAGQGRVRHEYPPLMVPALDQVTGWSRAG